MAGTIAKLVADVMEAIGPGRVYGVIGTSVLDLLDELYDRRDKLRYITTRHEQVAVSMADAESRVSENKVGLAIVHAGPGFLNSCISLGIARKDRVPLLLVSGGVRRRLYGTDSWLEVDQSRIASSIAKAYVRLNEPENAINILKKLLQEAWSPPRGPAVLEVPEDTWTISIEYSSSDVEEIARRLEPKKPPREIVEEIASLLTKAEKPVIFVSGEAVEWGLQGLYEELAERSGAYIVVSGNGRGACSEDNPRCLGRAGFGGGSLVADKALEESDLVISLGHEIDDITTYGYVLRIQGDLVIVSEDPIVEKRPVYYTEWYRENPVKTARILLEILRSRNIHRRLEDWDKTIEELREKWMTMLEEPMSRSYSGATNPAKFFQALDKALPRKRIVAAGQGTHVLYAYDYLRIFEPRTFLAATNLGAMGYALPAATAAKLAHPDYEVVAVVGDGELMMVVQDLETIAREKIPVKIIVVNDYSYRVLLLRQKIQKQGRIIGTKYTNPDFTRLAEAYGIKGIRVDNNAGLEDIARKVVEEQEPILVDLVVSEEDLPPLNLEYTLRMGG